MTVAALPSVASYVENGVSTVFAAPFRFKAAGDLIVERILAAGVVQALTPGVDYTVSGGGTDAGGTVTRTAATSGATLRIRRRTARSQPMVYTSGDRFPAKSHEDALDRAMLIDQEQDDLLADVSTRGLLAPVGEAGGVLPDAATRAGKALIGLPGGGFGVAAIGEGPDAGLRPDLAAGSGGGLIGFLRAAIGAVVRSIASKLAETVSVRDFGAACDGVTDDTAAVQACIAYCLSFTRARAMKVPGRCRIITSLLVDRQVDSTLSEFRILGEGEGAGFYTDQPITIIDTTLSYPADPRSEFVTFEGIQFEASSAGLAAMALSYKFLRMKFLHCYFRRIKVVDSPYYLQTWHFLHCNFRGWTGVTVRAAANLFDCDFTGNIWEDGEDGIQSLNTGGYGLRIVGNNFEGCRRFFRQAGGFALTVVGNYTEHNSQPDYTFTSIADNGACRGVVFQGNQMTHTHGLSTVGLGDVRGFLAGGNYSNDKLYDLTATRFARVCSIGDYAQNALFSDTSRALTVQPEGVNSIVTTVTAVTGGIGTATALTRTVNIVTTVPAGGGVGLPATDSLSDGGVSRMIAVTNAGANALTVYSAADDLANFGLNQSWPVPVGATRLFLQYGQAQMRPITPVLTAQADSTATNTPGMVADFNALLAKLRASGVMT